MASVASGRKEDGNTTDQSDQLMSRFSDILCFVLFSSSVPSFLLLGFWSGEGPRSLGIFIPDSHWSLLSPWRVYVSPAPNLRAPSLRASGTPQEVAYTRVSV